MKKNVGGGDEKLAKDKGRKGEKRVNKEKKG